MQTWFVYMIENTHGELYTGITTDVVRRFRQHGSQKGGAKFFRRFPPKELVYLHPVVGRSKALQIEQKIKRLSRKDKQKLIADLYESQHCLPS